MGRTGIAQELAEAGADIGIETANGLMALRVAEVAGHAGIAEFLRARAT
jgi:hypothetical protein